MIQNEVAGGQAHLLQFGRCRLDTIDFSGCKLPIDRLIPVGLRAHSVIRQASALDLAPPLRAAKNPVTPHYSPPPSPPCPPPSPPRPPLSPLPKPPRTTAPLSPENTSPSAPGSRDPPSTVSPTLSPLAPPYT